MYRTIRRGRPRDLPRPASPRGTLAAGEATAEQVLEGQLPYSCAWREQFNRGEIQAAAYAEGASLRVAAGPAGEGESEAHRLVGCEVLQGGRELRGRSAVAGFWERCVSFKAWGAYQDAAWSRIAVDANTVLVKGKVGFAGAYGETVELWRRSEETGGRSRARC
ncbi:unnamed protein product [Prorocentrum cordatum]|uniref:Uncharacterized protein n=1 Tax=Prorocentrum cordatum TaxID=2364126 RepID=A0ABN9UF06_9DINO|nr:unnamed protein product [Polarella glacialis]